MLPCMRPSVRARTGRCGQAWQLPTCPAAGSLCAMGLLDDAIKEHLELKRRRGGDPTEIERLEREALGPVRRVAQDAPPAEVADAVALEGSAAELPEDALQEGEEYGPEEDYGQESEFEYAPDHEDG